jgi:hypothetical protein
LGFGDVFVRGLFEVGGGVLREKKCDSSWLSRAAFCKFNLFLNIPF